MAGLQDYLGGKARSWFGAYRDWRDGPSAVRQLDTAFPQAEPQPGKTVAEVAPPRTKLSPEQWDALGNFNWSATFGGEGAATADLAALARAKALAKEGHEPRSVWGETGWFKGPEDRWKFEIDDSAAKLAPQPGLPDWMKAVDHPGVKEAYPDLWAGLKQSVTEARATKGSYFDSDKTLLAQGPTEPVQRSVALHELQHALQGREGFEGGGNPAGLVDRPMADRADDLLNEADRLADAGRHAEAAPLREQGKLLHDKARGFNAYERLAGEAEARAVQARADLTPAQRRAKFPLDSYDVPLDQLITRKPGWFPG